jgi:hypothetical protein
MVGAIISAIMRRFFSSPLDDAILAFILGLIFYLYGRVSRIEGKIELLPTSEEVRKIVREELGETKEEKGRN